MLPQPPQQLLHICSTYAWFLHSTGKLPEGGDFLEGLPSLSSSSSIGSRPALLPSASLAVMSCGQLFNAAVASTHLVNSPEIAKRIASCYLVLMCEADHLAGWSIADVLAELGGELHGWDALRSNVLESAVALYRAASIDEWLSWLKLQGPGIVLNIASTLASDDFIFE